jgi:hypothetical protein
MAPAAGADYVLIKGSGHYAPGQTEEGALEIGAPKNMRCRRASELAGRSPSTVIAKQADRETYGPKSALSPTDRRRQYKARRNEAAGRRGGFSANFRFQYPLSLC